MTMLNMVCRYLYRNWKGRVRSDETIHPKPGEINSILSGKLAAKHAGVHIEAMKAVEEAHRDRSLKKFEEALVKYKDGSSIFLSLCNVVEQ